MIALILLGGAAAFAVMLYACCRVAGDADRRAEYLWIQKEEGEEEYPRAWDEDDRKHSGLLEEDEE